ncbi:MAG TPA: TIGR02921 family PEP-CTERM protein, partial [Myxococcota bacterium]|nr:TIGR02921 family PEP-CTERM protein [Myxococcota bacterium]
LLALVGAGGVVGSLTWADRQKEHLHVPEFVDPSGDADRLALMLEEEPLRRALVDQALASYRYLGATEDADFLLDLWRRELGVEATWPQDTFNLLIHPLLYEGSLREQESETARVFYGQLFDQPFDKAEREALRTAMNATWDRSSAKAGLSDIDKKTVHLEKQSLSWVEQNSLAVVTLDEVYANTSEAVQEIHLSFSMPESAAFTGLWLSDDATQPEKYPAVLAPRGAAQATYDRIRERGSDPAILEQVGPRQYRLRVFPIPVQRGEEHPRMYLRMRWSTLADAVGIPAPQLLEVRNLYWDAETMREQQGRATTEQLWLPPRVGVVGQLRSHATTLADGRVLRATPAEAMDVSALVKPARYAVLVDGTRSMRPLAGRVQQELAWLRTEVAPGATVEVYVSSGWGGRPFRKVGLDWQPEELDFFGGAMVGQALESLSKEGSWDSVIFLTDNGSYDVFESVVQTQQGAETWGRPVTTTSPDLPLPSNLPASLWLVHLGGALPQGYPDPLADRLNSTGGIGTSAEEVFQRILLPGQDRVDGYVWTVEEAAPGAVSERDLDAMAVRRLLSWEVRSAGTVSDYDHIHQLAKGAHVVTPWSSMLVLVEDWQRKLLEEQEAKEDRFDRETDRGSEFKSAPGSPLVSAVPEPEEWLLLALGTGILGYWYWKRKAERRIAT